MIRQALAVMLLGMMAQSAFATCTEEEVKQKRQTAWYRASLFQMQDLSQGRLLLQKFFAMQFAVTRSPIVDGDDVCARYDEIAKEANDGLRKPIRTGPAGTP